MSEWVETYEDGLRWWLHDTLGNVVELGESEYFGTYPYIIKLGPFETAEQAQQAIENNRTLIDHTFQNLNQQIVDLTTQTKKE